MTKKYREFVRRLRESRGATMAEYAMLIAVVGLVVVVAARALGTSVSAKLTNTADQIRTG